MEEKESKHDKFKRLATTRVRNAIKRIELIGNFASSGYEYTEEEAEKMLGVLQETLDGVKSKFSSKKPSGPPKFEM